MKVVFPTSTPTTRKVEVSSIHAGFECLLSCAEYAEALNEKAEHGQRLVYFGAYSDAYESLPKISTFVGFDSVYDVPFDKDFGVIVHPENPYKFKRWKDAYKRASNSSDVNVIVIDSGSNTPLAGPLGSFERIVYINALVEQGIFCTDKPHWLYGVENPAELGVYSKLFSNFVSSRIELAICSTCFLYSIYGVQFSSYSGIMHRLSFPDSLRVSDLGMLEWIDYEMSREQMRCFHMNADIAWSFASGSVGEGYMGSVCAILEERSI